MIVHTQSPYVQGQSRSPHPCLTSAEARVRGGCGPCGSVRWRRPHCLPPGRGVPSRPVRGGGRHGAVGRRSPAWVVRCWAVEGGVLRLLRRGAQAAVGLRHVGAIHRHRLHLGLQLQAHVGPRGADDAPLHAPVRAPLHHDVPALQHAVAVRGDAAAVARPTAGAAAAGAAGRGRVARGRCQHPPAQAERVGGGERCGVGSRGIALRAPHLCEGTGRECGMGVGGSVWAGGGHPWEGGMAARVERGGCRSTVNSCCSHERDPHATSA
jgi:hypothetical protein